MTTIITTQFDSDGIATLTWNDPNHSTNLLYEESMKEFEATLEMCRKKQAKGIIITSGKSTFIAGADIRFIQKMIEANDHKAFRHTIDHLHRILRDMEQQGIPVVAAINGLVLGGGFELCLACHHRIALNRPDIRIGLPEAQLGIFPGLGGTVRSLHLLGCEKALGLLLKGQTVRPDKAQTLGWINALASSEEELLSQAKAWLLSENAHSTQPWDHPKHRLSDRPFTPKGALVWLGANSLLKKESKGVYPHLEFLLQASYEAAMVDFDLGLTIERDYFIKAAMSPQANSMLQSLFVDRQSLRAGDQRSAEFEKKQIKHVLIIGAGFMGSSIAYCAATTGVKVSLMDQNQELANAGVEKANTLIEQGLNRKVITPEKAEKTRSLIHAVLPSDQPKNIDLVIEAVFEDRTIKEKTLKTLCSWLPKDTIIGSNTSTLPIDSLAPYVSHPERFIGIHFFSPVHRMELVELIRGSKTDAQTVAHAIDWVTQLKKTPIVVNDGRGFYTTRVVISYLNEGMRMVTEGIDPVLIENAGKQLLMPVGPLSLTDEIALDLAHRIQKQTEADLGQLEDDPAHELINFMVVKNNRLGRKNKAGFYDYEANKKHIWDGLSTFRKAEVNPLFSHIQDRLFYRQIAEILQCFNEGILDQDSVANIGALLGWGFCPWTGGPMMFIQRVGVDAVAQKLKALGKSEGKRFDVAMPKHLGKIKG